MTQIDLKKEYKYLYAPSAKKVELVDVPRLSFVMLDGEIEPGMGPSTSQSFQDALQALYGISYTLKFTSKLRKTDPIDYSVMALEALWWVESGQFNFANPTAEPWKYTAMIFQPGHIDQAMFVEGLAQLRKKRGDSPALAKLRLEGFQEGLAVQTLHIGPYAAEPATLEKMYAFARENGYTLHGKHHEIYMGDPRKAAPEKLKTILRHPVTK